MPTTSRTLLTTCAALGVLLLPGLGGPVEAATPARPTLAGTFSRADNLADGSAPAYGAEAVFLSAHGRHRVFDSASPDLAPGNGEGPPDVFVQDAVTGTTTLVSRTTAGRAANDQSYESSISATGRYVAYSSYSTDLPGSDEGDGENVYRYDRRTGETDLVTRKPRGSSGRVAYGQISATGRFVAFATTDSMLPSDRNDQFDVYLWDARTDGLTLVSRSARGGAAGGSFFPSVSADGHVLFVSGAPDLRPGPPASPSPEAGYLWDPSTRQISLVSHLPGSALPVPTYNVPRLSDNGGFVAFTYLRPGDDGTTGLYLYDVRSRVVREIVDPAVPGRDYDALALSGNGRLLLFRAAHNAGLDPADRSVGTTELYDRVTGGFQVVTDRQDLYPTDLSADGRHVGFWSSATDLVPGRDTNDAPDAFVWSRS